MHKQLGKPSVSLRKVTAPGIRIFVIEARLMRAMLSGY